MCNNFINSLKQLMVVMIIMMITILRLNGNATDELNFVSELLAAKHFDQAFIQANTIITDYPNTFESFEARLMLADILQELQSYQDARLQLLLLIRNPFQLTFSQQARAYYSLGIVFYREQNYEQAIESFRKLFLDYGQTKEAEKAITLYFDCFYQLHDYQTAIVRARELAKNYSQAEQKAEFLFQEAKAYFIGNMLDQAKRIILEIKSEYSHTTSAWKIAELEVQIKEREKGKFEALQLLETILSVPTSRLMEEKLTWILINYYLATDQAKKAKDKLDGLISKFTLAEDLSEYLLLWLKMMHQAQDYRPILEKEQFIINVNRHKPEYFDSLLLIARAHYLVNNFWQARTLLEEQLPLLQTADLKYRYYFLYAEIYRRQGQYVNSIEMFHKLINEYGSLGKNFEALMALGDIYLQNMRNVSQALSYYRQASTLAGSSQQNELALLKTASCLEILHQYSDALTTLMQIPLEQLQDPFQNTEIFHKITLLYIYYQTDHQKALSIYLMLNLLSGSNLSTIDYASILALELKQFPEALALLNANPSYENQIEALKINFLYAYKYLLENYSLELEKQMSQIEKMIKNLGSNIHLQDRVLINIWLDFIHQKGSLSEKILPQTLSFIQQEGKLKGIDFRNFFKYQLWNYYSLAEKTAYSLPMNQNFTSEEAEKMAQTIVIDPLVSDLAYQNINILLATSLYQKGLYSEATNYFHLAERYLSISYPEYYYQYAICLHNLKRIPEAMEILQKLVVNNVENNQLQEARKLVLNYLIERGELADALDILNQIPLFKRNDADFRYLVSVYHLLQNSPLERENILYLQEKTIDDLQRLATLHFEVNDPIMAEYTWNEVLSKATLDSHKLNAYAGLGNLFYQTAQYSQALPYYNNFFRLYQKQIPEQDFLIPPGLTATQQIISLYLTNNLSRAEATQKSLHYLFGKNDDLVREIKLYEAVYWVKNDEQKALRLLNQLVEDQKMNPELAFKVLFWRGTNNIQLKFLDQAEADFIAVLHTTDDQLRNQVFLKLGNLYLLQDNAAKALEYYYLAIMQDQVGDIAKDAAHNFALTARNMQEWDKAMAAYKIIIDRWGQTYLSAETKLTIGFSFYMAGEYDQTLNLLNHILKDLKTTDHKAEAQYWIAESYFQKEEYATAEKEFAKIKTNYSTAGRWMELVDLRIAETYFRREEIATAKKILQNVIRVYGASSNPGNTASKLLLEYENLE